MAKEPLIAHTTPAGGNIFADLGFSAEEAASLKAAARAGTLNKEGYKD